MGSSDVVHFEGDQVDLGKIGPGPGANQNLSELTRGAAEEGSSFPQIKYFFDLGAWRNLFKGA